MAIYHCSVKIIGRSAGRSSVAAAAYRSGEEIKNEYDGIVHDYTNKNWVEHTEIVLPKNAPDEYEDRGTLWNSVELAEKSQNAQLAREFELALPQELSKEEQIEIVQEFVKENLISEGMIADIAIHNPPVTNDRHQPIDNDGRVTRDKEKMQFINPHAHILTTMRPMDENGKWQNKTEAEYVCKKGDKEEVFTSTEYQIAKENGWEKQYRYYDGKEKNYYTPTEAKNKDLKRVDRNPKKTRYGRKNEVVEKWNSKEKIYEWREKWEKTINGKLQEIGSDVQVDSRSFKDQGRTDEVPTLHMGTSATNMEKRADREIREGKSETEVKRSDIGNINRQIKEHNKFVRELKAKFNQMVDKAKDFVDVVSKKLESFRSRIIGNKYEESVLQKEYNALESKLTPEGNILEKYNTEVIKVEEANKQSGDSIRKLKNELQNCKKYQVKEKNRIQNEIKKEMESIEHRNDYKENISRMCNISSKDEYKKASKELEKKEKDLKNLETTINKLKDDNSDIKNKYIETEKTIPEDQKEKVKGKREQNRDLFENSLKERLEKKYQDKFDEKGFGNIRDNTDKELSALLNVESSGLEQEKEIKISHHH